MNSAAACHEIESCPGLFVDAFRGSYLGDKTSDPNNAFILTHYHGDHYGNLPREGKYQGPARIHCTPVTAALLTMVHQVPADLVSEHKYGETWNFRINPKENKKSSGEESEQQSPEKVVQITFYDANHCPGAAICAIQFHDGTVSLHTGDMRYHSKMKRYPIIQKAVSNRKLDLVYLDTTYGHPKHDFVPQEVAIDSIASHVHQTLGSKRQLPSNDRSQPQTLVLLSCYSIGKEKVLWEASSRTNQLVYVTERKLQMMHCIQSPKNGNETLPSENSSDDAIPCSQMIERCTRDPNASDIHVIPMGLAGKMWPFFQPDYRKCVDYAEDLDRAYDKVVAWIPTGWANASNWNKKNAISRRRLECRKSNRFVDVEIRLISYSEHSAFTELSEFVEYLKPRKVIPTVFSDDKDCRRIEKLFKKYIDSSRAKLQFFKSMQSSADSNIPVPGTIVPHVKKEESPPTANERSENQNNAALVDLTFSSDEETDGDCGAGVDIAPQSKQLSSLRNNNEARSPGSSTTTEKKNSPTSAQSPRSQGYSKTPTKRKRESPSSTKSTTPLITSFFSAAAKR